MKNDRLAYFKSKLPERAGATSLVILMVILAWTPFPLGSNREWSWSVLLLLLSVAWLSWSVWGISTFDVQARNLKRVALPLILAAMPLCWSVIQAFPFAPENWKHPLWQIAASVLGRHLAGSISLNPWKTIIGALQLSLSIATTWLAYSLARNQVRASRLFNWVIGVGAFYACYAFLLHLLRIQQPDLFYSVHFTSALSGPFVQKNNFATYEGLVVLSSCAALVSQGYGKVTVSRGARRTLISAIRFVFGAGAPALAATILSVSALFGTASRGGAISTVAGILCMAALGAIACRKKLLLKPTLAAVGISSVFCAGLFLISGATLAGRLGDLAGSANSDLTRAYLRESAMRMIHSSPMLGLGLGTFEDAYPMYARREVPYLIDKVHNDYLEFAAGLGLPAAICWWLAMSLILLMLGRGVLKRRKDRIYPLVAGGATILIAAHSVVDFSLQIPAVAVTYSILLGVGLAQSFPVGAGPGSADHIQKSSASNAA